MVTICNGLIFFFTSCQWFEEKQQQFENLDQQLRKLHGSVEALVCHRKGRSFWYIFSVKISTLPCKVLENA